MTQSVVTIAEENSSKSIIDHYIDKEKRGLSRRRKDKIRQTLGKLERVFLKKPLEDVTKDDLEAFIENLREDNLGEEFEDSTKLTYRKIIKPFFRWLHPEDPSFSSWIKTGTYRATLGPDDILTTQELDAMRDAARKFPHNMVRLETLYETAARPMEFLAAWKHDLIFEPNNGPVTFHIERGKTGKSRDILLFQDAKPLLQRWVFNEHPLRDDADFPLWVDMSSNSNRDALRQVGLRKFVARISAAAGIKKIVTPYTLRHTRLTDLARAGANEALLCQIAGWRLESKMPSVYIHLSKRDQRPMMEKLLGITVQENQDLARRVPRTCPSCHTTNTSDSKVCHVCGIALDPKTALEMSRKRDDMVSEITNAVLKKLAGINAEVDSITHESI
jgi:site-specific recombinase XerD